MSAAAAATTQGGERAARGDPHRLGHGDERPIGERGPAPKRIIVGYGFWIFLLSDFIMFAAFFAAYAVLVGELAGGPAGRDLFAVLGAGKVQVLRRLGILHALPQLMVSVRITAPTAVLGAMLAEFLMGAHGLGALFSESRSYMDMERSWGVALVATVLSVLVFLAARGLEHRVVAPDHDGHVRGLRVGGRADVEGVDVEPAAAEHAGDARENAKFVFDQDGKGMTHEVERVRQEGAASVRRIAAFVKRKNFNMLERE